MRIKIIVTPTGYVPQLRDAGKTVWEGTEHSTPEAARTTAINWLNSDSEDNES